MAGNDTQALLDAASRGDQPALDYADLLSWNAATRPHSTALVLSGREVSFAELNLLSDRAATRLHARGVQVGDRIGLLGANTVEWLTLALGALRSGCTVVPINARYTTTEITALLHRADLRLLLAQPRFGRKDLASYLNRPEIGGLVELATFDSEVDGLEHIDGTGADVARGDVDGTGQAAHSAGQHAGAVGMTLYTSGSTSAPKGCMLTQVGMIRNAVLHTARLGIDERDRWFSPMPFFHAGGFVWGVTSMLVTGTTLISQEIFDAGQALDLIETYDATYHHGVDTMFITEMEHPAFSAARLSSVRIANSTGGRPVLERISTVMRVPGTVSKWGITEGYGNLTLSAPHDPLEKRLTTVGRRYPGIEYRIGEAKGEGVGEILIRSSVMEGYFRDPAATREAIDPDGWLHTGDLGSFDPDGYLRYAGRIKQMLKVGGENVSALEIEGLLLAHPGVTAACVVGLPHPRLGEVPIAVVQASQPDPRMNDLLTAFCVEHLARFKVPAQIILVGPGEMPMTGSGKPDVARIRQLVEARSCADAW